MDWLTQLQLLGTVALAGMLGGIIGIEREFAGKPAGLRTHFFVAASAALLMTLGEAILDSYAVEVPDRVLTPDPLRLVQAIVIGISFLGTGTIVREHDDSVEGLTTAASILLTAGVGIAVALGQYVLAGGISLLAVAVLLVFGWVNSKFIHRHRRNQ